MYKHHGSYNICINEQIIILVAYDSWNEEASAACINEMNFIVNTMQYDRFAVLMDTTKLEGATQEALALWVPVIDLWFKNGHRQFARVDNENTITYKLFLSKFDDILKSIMPHKFFNSIEDGLSWIKKSNFKGFENFMGLNNEDCIKSSN
jgi:hypothetical protein